MESHWSHSSDGLFVLNVRLKFVLKYGLCTGHAPQSYWEFVSHLLATLHAIHIIPGKCFVFFS